MLFIALNVHALQDKGSSTNIRLYIQVRDPSGGEQNFK